MLAPAILPSITNTESKISNGTNSNKTFAHALYTQANSISLNSEALSHNMFDAYQGQIHASKFSITVSYIEPTTKAKRQGLTNLTKTKAIS